MKSKQKENNIVRYKRKRQFNFISIVFVMILIYMTAQILIMVNRESVRVYTLDTAVESTRMHEYRGVITREEQILRTEESGYVNYYVREGKRVGVGSAVYTTDGSGEFSRMLAETYTDGTYLADEMLAELKKKLSSTSREGITGDFQAVYKNKADISATVADAFLYTAMEELNEGQTAESLGCVKTDQSGYIMFRTDSLDGLTPDKVTKKTFDENRVETKVYTSGEERAIGTFAYKLIPDDTFSITFMISEADAKRYQDKKYLSIELVSLGVTVSGSFSMFLSDDGMQLATVTLKKYGSEYLSDRFVDFKITESSVRGYKIPVTAVTDKEFLVIPREYITLGGDNSKTYGVCRENYGEEEEWEFISVAIYAETDAYYYISSSRLAVGDYLVQPDSRDRFLISITAPLQGVFNVNKGYCIFRQVEIINTTTDGNYYMIKAGTRYGLSPYDRIVQDAGTVVENQIIY